MKGRFFAIAPVSWLCGVNRQIQAAIESFTDAAPAQAQLSLGSNPFIGNAIGRRYRLGLPTRFGS